MADNERLRDVIDFYKMSVSAFSKHIELKGPQPLYDILKRRNSISKSIADRISAKCVEINVGWLLTGEGSMLKDSTENGTVVESSDSFVQGKVVPFYDVEAAAGIEYGMDMTPTSRPARMIQIGGFLSDSETAIQVFGNSMAPNYPAGCIIGLKPHRDSFIEPGKVYVVETRDSRYLKRLYINHDHTAYRCVSDNHMKHTSGSMAGEYCYPEFEIPFDEVVRLHRVTGVVKRNDI